MMATVQCQGHGPPYLWEQIDVASLTEVRPEEMGKKEKLWFEAPGEGQAQPTLWLFKQVRDAGGLIPGEDWAEGLVHVLAQGLGIPSVCVALAARDGRRGVLVRTLLAAGESLSHGDEVMAVSVAGYDAQEGRKNPDYTLANIRKALEPYGGGVDDEPFSAFDVIASYFMLDALVAGRDRHHKNWGVRLSLSGAPTLAPTFDHGNALGFAASLEQIDLALSSEARFQKWLHEGRSQYLPRRPTLVTVAAEALLASEPLARAHFVDRLESLDLRQFEEAAEAMPVHILSEAHRRFAIRIVEANRRRLLDELARRER